MIIIIKNKYKKALLSRKNIYKIKIYKLIIFKNRIKFLGAGSYKKDEPKNS